VDDADDSGSVSDERGGLPVDPDADTGPAPPSTNPWVHRRLDLLAAVAAGGAIGNLGRYGVGRAFPVEPGHFPVSTLVINTTGSFALGFVLVLLVERLPPTRYARAFLGIGMLGAFTTFSTFAVQASQLASEHHLATAAAFVAASVGGGLAAAGLGVLVGRAAPHRRPAPPPEVDSS
jgi:CrcB protein